MNRTQLIAMVVAVSAAGLLTAQQPAGTGTWQASGTHGAVAAGGKEAADAGLTILKAGGNAADAAVATLMDLIKPFRNLPSDLRQDNIWHDFVHMTIHSNLPLEDPTCIYCRTHMLLLKQEDNYRLEMPALGKLT